MVTARLALHPPAAGTEKLGDYFPEVYATDLQAIDDNVQIKDVAGAGLFPVYDVNGFLVPSEIAPEDLEVGLLDSILTTQGMILYRNATELAALSPDTAGKSLLTGGVGANPSFGYPSHSTLLNLTTGDPHTQYLLRSVLASRGSLPFFGAAGWAELVKGTEGYLLMQGANDPYWGLPKLDDLAAPDDNTDLNASTSKHGLMQKYPNTQQRLKGTGGWADPIFGVNFPFGNGAAVLTAEAQGKRIPVACKITKAYLRSTKGVDGDLLSGSITVTIYIHDYNVDADSVAASDTFSLSSASSYAETGLSIAVAAGKYITAIISGIATCKCVTLDLELEAT